MTASMTVHDLPIASYKAAHKLFIEDFRHMRNNLSTLALVALLTLGTTGGIFAQETQTAGQQAQRHGHRQLDPNHQLRHLTRVLSLTADQQTQIRPILQDRDQKLEQLLQNHSLSRKDLRRQRETIDQDATQKVETVLNDQQKQAYEQMKQHKKHKHRAAQ
jgi:Spy/CpxP family protein refolding chaperone